MCSISGSSSGKGKLKSSFSDSPTDPFWKLFIIQIQESITFQVIQWIGTFVVGSGNKEAPDFNSGASSNPQLFIGWNEECSTFLTCSNSRSLSALRVMFCGLKIAKLICFK